MLATRIGKYRYRLTIQKVAESQDNMGGLAATWSTFAEVWGSVEPLRGKESFMAHEKQARMDARIRLRYLAGITAKMRVLFGSHTYQIVSVINPEMRNRELQLMVWEITPV